MLDGPSETVDAWSGRNLPVVLGEEVARGLMFGCWELICITFSGCVTLCRSLPPASEPSCTQGLQYWPGLRPRFRCRLPVVCSRSAL